MLRQLLRNMNRKVAYVLSVLTFIVCAYLCVQMAATLSGGAVAGILAVFVVGYVYIKTHQHEKIPQSLAAQGIGGSYLA
ncbi:MAG: hypothetical protein ACLUS6_16935 [Dysosmobacter sp.]